MCNNKENVEISKYDELSKQYGYLLTKYKNRKKHESIEKMLKLALVSLCLIEGIWIIVLMLLKQ